MMRSWRQPNEDVTVPGGARICWAGLADAATAEEILATIVKLCLKYRLRVEVRGPNKSMAVKSVERSSVAAAPDAGIVAAIERGPASLNVNLMALEKLTTISEPFRLHPAGVTSNVLEA
jgi:hypothetical protein